MRQQHHQAILAQPLGLSTHQKLVEDGLGAIGKVAKLRLPQDQRIGVLQGISQLKACSQGQTLAQRAHSGTAIWSLHASGTGQGCLGAISRAANLSLQQYQQVGVLQGIFQLKACALQRPCSSLCPKAIVPSCTKRINYPECAIREQTGQGERSSPYLPSQQTTRQTQIAIGVF